MDEAPRSSGGPRQPAHRSTFGVFFFDYDLDGYPDIFAANGHIEEEIGRVQPKIHYQEPPLLFRNLGGKKFENVSTPRGSAIYEAAGGARRGLWRLRSRWRSGRSDHHEQRARRTCSATTAATAITGCLSAPSGPNPIATASARWCDRGASGKQWNMVRSGSSYASQSDLALTFGLGQDPLVTSVQVEWPSGTKQNFSNVAANQFITIDETRGIMK